MANTIKIKRSAVAAKVPLTTDLQLGELAINTYDGKLYTKKSVSGVESIVDLSAGTSGGASASSPITQSAYVIGQDITLTTNYHGLSLYSAEISAGYSVTVPANAIWTIAVF
jgi:hypothetical protein